LKEKNKKLEIKEARQLITENMKEEGCISYQVLVKIPGEYLIKHNLVDAWATLRNQSVKEISKPGYEDYITLIQAESLGLLDFVKA